MAERKSDDRVQHARPSDCDRYPGSTGRPGRHACRVKKLVSRPGKPSRRDGRRCPGASPRGDYITLGSSVRPHVNTAVRVDVEPLGHRAALPALIMRFSLRRACLGDVDAGRHAAIVGDDHALAVLVKHVDRLASKMSPLRGRRKASPPSRITASAGKTNTSSSFSTRTSSRARWPGRNRHNNCVRPPCSMTRDWLASGSKNANVRESGSMALARCWMRERLRQRRASPASLPRGNRLRPASLLTLRSSSGVSSRKARPSTASDLVVRQQAQRLPRLHLLAQFRTSGWNLERQFGLGRRPAHYAKPGRAETTLLSACGGGATIGISVRTCRRPRRRSARPTARGSASPAGTPWPRPGAG